MSTDKLILSATQINNYTLCPRKWWFNYIQKQPVPKKSWWVFGSVFQSLVEKICKTPAQDLDLYEEGWDKDLPKHEALLIQTLIQLGIEKGFIVKTPGAKIEYRFDIDVYPNVSIIGYIDEFIPREKIVSDNKTTKDKRYAITKRKLPKDLQMVIYGNYAGQELELKENDELILRHNTYIKNIEEPDCFRIESKVVFGDLKDRYENVILPTVSDMVSLWEDNVELQDWEKVKGPITGVAACNAYGGCPFLEICNHMKKPAKFIAKSELEESPEWAIPTCVACKGSGYNTQGNKCFVCWSKFTKSQKASQEPPQETSKAPQAEPQAEPQVEPVEPQAVSKAPQAEPQVEPVEPQAVSKAPQATGFDLYLFCMPANNREDIIFLDILHSNLGEKLAAKSNIESYWDLDAFRRRDQMAQVCPKIVKSLEGKSVVVRSKSPDLDAFVTALIPLANNVITSLYV